MVSLKEMYVFARCICCSCVSSGGCVVHLLAQEMKCVAVILLRNGSFSCSSLDMCCIKTFDWSLEYCVCVCSLTHTCMHWYFHCECLLLVGIVWLVHVGCAKIALKCYGCLGFDMVEYCRLTVMFFEEYAAFCIHS
jgi:hypothetical protein